MKIIPEHNILVKHYIFNGLIEHIDDRYPDSTFYHKNGKIHFELDTKNNILWCNYVHVWCVFSNKGELYYDETLRVIKNWVERHTNWGSITPLSVITYIPDWVERHANWGSITPQIVDINGRKRWNDTQKVQYAAIGQ